MCDFTSSARDDPSDTISHSLCETYAAATSSKEDSWSLCGYPVRSSTRYPVAGGFVSYWSSMSESVLHVLIKYQAATLSEPLLVGMIGDQEQTNLSRDACRDAATLFPSLCNHVARPIELSDFPTLRGVSGNVANVFYFLEFGLHSSSLHLCS